MQTMTRVAWDALPQDEKKEIVNPNSRTIRRVLRDGAWVNVLLIK
jgi:hypothetical protein